MWRLWSGYVVALNGITLILGVFLTGCETTDVLFCLWYSSSSDNSTLVTTLCFWSLEGWMEIILCCCYIVYGKGQSRVCTRVFRWWFTYILSSWVTDRISLSWERWLFMAGRLDKLSSFGRMLLWTGIISWSPLALAFNTLQLFSNYFECMHRRFWGHTCAMTHQLRPFPKDLFALQSAYIPVYWVYLEVIISKGLHCQSILNLQSFEP